MTTSNPDQPSKEPASAGFSWGNAPTRFFYELTPDVIFSAVEALGYRCTGRCMPLNSMENRVLEVEIEPDQAVESESDRFRIVKFYRPLRWNRKQIMEEHQFLEDLKNNEVPVVVPEADSHGETLFELHEQSIFYCLYPKIGGRNPDELSRDQLQRVGRLLAQLHNIGSRSEAPHRIRLTPESYGLTSLDFLLDSESIPVELEDDFMDVVEEICDRAEPYFASATVQRVHGDCHYGNVLWSPAGPFFVDFDDMVVAPPVQDIWLLTPGRDEDSLAQREVLLGTYETLTSFDRNTLLLVEPLRALRFIHFSAWIAKRWSDPAFKRTFPEFSATRYWNEQLHDLRECLESIRE
ncbi:MAG: serine/threonine protein kinase, partial [Verrucomicrobiota bacterium]